MIFLQDRLHNQSCNWAAIVREDRPEFGDRFNMLQEVRHISAKATWGF